MSRRIQSPRFPLVYAGLLLAGGVLTAQPAHAQFATSIPYSPYSTPYRSFSYPTLVNPSLPNQARLGTGPTLGGGVSLDTGPDLLSIDPYGNFNRPTGGRYTPYYSAYRTPDRFSSTYVQRDQDYASNLARRDQLFYLMRAEQDPKRRAELATELDKVNKALRDAGSTARRPRTARSATPGAAPAAGRRTSRGNSVAVPAFPDGTAPRRSAPGLTQPPVTPPAAAPGATTAPKPTSSDPLDILNRSRNSGLPGASFPSSLPGSTDPAEAFRTAPQPSPSRVVIRRPTAPEAKPVEPSTDPIVPGTPR